MRHAFLRCTCCSLQGKLLRLLLLLRLLSPEISGLGLCTERATVDSYLNSASYLSVYSYSWETSKSITYVLRQRKTCFDGKISKVMISWNKFQDWLIVLIGILLKLFKATFLKYIHCIWGSQFLRISQWIWVTSSEFFPFDSGNYYTVKMRRLHQLASLVFLEIAGRRSLEAATMRHRAAASNRNRQRLLLVLSLVYSRWICICNST